MHRSDSAMLEGMLQTVKGMASQHDGKGSLSNSADAFGDSPPQRSLPPHYNDNHCDHHHDQPDHIADHLIYRGCACTTNFRTRS